MYSSPLVADASQILAYLLATAIHNPNHENEKTLKEAILTARGFDWKTLTPGSPLKDLFNDHSPWRTKTRWDLFYQQQIYGPTVETTLEGVLWSLLKTDNFKDAVLMASNLGDTLQAERIAAITGQIAGALYGKNNIPQEWLKQLVMGDKIEELATKLAEYHLNHTAGSHIRQEVFPTSAVHLPEN